ncbi:unannotated protein [freshwater metagenome]|uniref:Unannotated protein n=1 Tax=freshwater metagenome TaxID=449393 RepID=A0A6J7QAE9_9ZZZZ
MSLAHTRRAALNFAISGMKSMLLDRKVKRVGATESMLMPRRTHSSRYARAFANVKAISWIAFDPDSRMWYPLIASETQRGISRAMCSITSTESLRPVAAGKICVPRAMYSLRTSFWTNMPNSFGFTPRFAARAWNIATQM